MRIEINTEEKKIIILESVNLYEFLDELEKMEIINDRKYTIEVKVPPIVPWTIPWNPIHVTPYYIEPIPWRTPEVRPMEPYYYTNN